MPKNYKSLLTTAGITAAACAMAVTGVTAASAASPAGARPGIAGTGAPGRVQLSTLMSRRGSRWLRPSRSRACASIDS
jgi:hypothetical protein